jgi:hypothetical protein
MHVQLFLTLVLSLQHADSQAAQPQPEETALPPTAETPALPPPPAPDRWLLMETLQGTWPGWCLDGNKITISGWTEVSFTASSATSENLPMGFNYRANEFAVQQNWLRIDRPVDQSATTPTWGFRSDTILPGIDYRFTLPRGIFNDQLTARTVLPSGPGQGITTKPAIYGIDPIQFYFEAYFPEIGRGMDVKFGRVFCQYGVEANDAPSNALMSHAYTFIYDPFTHTGLMTTIKLTPAWSIQAGVMLGSDVFIDPADRLTFMGDFKWAPPGGRDSVLFSFILGPGRFEPERSFNNPNILDLVYTHQCNARLTYSFESLAGYQTNVPGVGTAHWAGVINYLTYQFSPRVSGTTRLEFFDDEQGQRTGFKGLYTAVTGGLTIKLAREIIIRPELRYDDNGKSKPFEDRHQLFTAATDLILRW